MTKRIVFLVALLVLLPAADAMALCTGCLTQACQKARVGEVQIPQCMTEELPDNGAGRHQLQDGQELRRLRRVLLLPRRPPARRRGSADGARPREDHHRDRSPAGARCQLMLRTASVVLLFLASAARADHLICLAADGVFRPPAGCIAQERPAPVPAAAVDRKFAYVNSSANFIILGTLPAHATDVDLWPGAMMAFGYDLEGTTPGTVVFAEERLESWSLTLDGSWFVDGRLNVHLPDGTFDYSVTRGGKVLDAEKGRRFRSVPRPAPRATRGPGEGRVTLSGSAVAPDGTAADFAVITADCKREVCTANADGTFRCTTPLPVDRSFCVEHPSGRKRVELEGRTGQVDLGSLQLVAGGTIRVVKPSHVELPEGRDGVAAAQAATGRRAASHRDTGPGRVRGTESGAV